MGEFNGLCPKTCEHPSATNYASLRQDMLFFSAILWFQSHESYAPLLLTMVVP
jgi:hypothetical protein